MTELELSVLACRYCNVTACIAPPGSALSVKAPVMTPPESAKRDVSEGWTWSSCDQRLLTPGATAPFIAGGAAEPGNAVVTSARARVTAPTRVLKLATPPTLATN